MAGQAPGVQCEGCHACNRKEPICQAQCSQAPKERSGHEGEPGWLTSPCPSSLINSHFVYPASFISLQFTANYPELHINFYRVPRKSQGLSPLQFPCSPDRLWAAPTGHPKTMLIFSGPRTGCTSLVCGFVFGFLVSSFVSHWML